ncbi:hypothetical protein BJ875DRAFT_479810 [Amylocarpus encephaloides]|uniref:Uncharacterized protein n=1 Tax=Amylocarpus encephaloides TaxID=45428 RepID=A0A9P7YSH8_9HELO|nr:hypothetical protein BJ875DRAFT_479810 [Amylocarpus encephaloides]
MGWARKEGIDQKKIFTIGYWPFSTRGVSDLNETTEVPSEILYLSKGDNLSHDSANANHLVEADEICTGYKLQDLVRRNGNIERLHPVRLLKHLLDSSEHTQQTRKDLFSIFHLLKKKWNLGTPTHFIVDLMTSMMKHAESQLRIQGISKKVPVEVVISVPVTWDTVACRTMQSVIEKSIQNAGLGCCKDLFLVSEAEAAAVHIITETQCVEAGKCFTVLDIGGGTVDTATYQLAQAKPPRLTEELAVPEGSLLGSTFLDQAFRRLVEQRTKGEDRNIERIANNIFFDFPGLKYNAKKRFELNMLVITREEMLKIFEPVMDGIWQLLSRQLEHARANRKYIQLVLLIGGFSKSALLRRYLKEKLDGIAAPLERHKHPENAVLLGSIKRALNKADGPERILNCAYGFKCTEQFLPDDETTQGNAHRKQSAFRTMNRLLGGYELKNTLFWVVNKNNSPERESMRDGRTQLSIKSFLALRRSPHQPKARGKDREPHRKNAGAKCIGRVTVDVAPLFRGGQIQPTLESEGEARYEVELGLVFTIVCRALKFEARVSSADENGGRMQFIIASDFVLGTA